MNSSAPSLHEPSDRENPAGVDQPVLLCHRRVDYTSRPRSTMVNSWLKHPVLVGGLLVLLYACGDPPASEYPTQQFHVEDTTLGPGDVFEVRIYRQEEMSGTYSVSAEGTISFPLIGAVAVGGKTPVQVENEIRTRLADGYLVNPQVSLLVKEYNSRNISVFGQVQKPGRLPFTHNMTIVEAISQAGGFSAMAKKNAVTVTRTEAGKKTNYTVPVESIGNGEAPNFFLRPGDIVFVPERLF